MRRARFYAGLALSWLVLGCQPAKQSFNNTDITGVEYGKRIELRDTGGRLRRLEDLRGNVVALFFGYTHCPDVCPTTLADLASISKQLGQDAARFQIAFVTVDPARDTAAVMGAYASNFGTNVIALRGDEAATRAAAQEFKIMYRVAGEPPNYTVDHTTGIYLIDTRGRLCLYVRQTEAASAGTLADVKTLLAEKS